jgi:UTP--glucose-1-phosphate uridylyltransferase
MTGDQYDRRLFERLLADFRAGALRSDAASNDSAAYAPVRAEEIDELPKPGSSDHQGCLHLGREALRAGQVAQVVLAGGAGTRFGGMVKGLVPVFKGYTFLDLKLEAARAVGQRYGRAVTSALMTSDLTDDPIAKHLHQFWAEEPVRRFRQQMLPRITPGGVLYRDARGRLSFAPSGHGDFYRAIRETGLADELFASGVRYLFFSNVDNLAATLDPVAVGFHISRGQPMTVEATERALPGQPPDPGGAPVRVANRIILREQVNADQHPLISTNNFTFSLDALMRKRIVLPFRAVKKQADGADVFQFEAVSGEATALLDEKGEPVLPSAWVRVARTGEASRFYPVKTRADLDKVVRALKSRLEVLAASMEARSVAPPGQ